MATNAAQSGSSAPPSVPARFPVHGPQLSSSSSSLFSSGLEGSSRTLDGPQLSSASYSLFSCDPEGSFGHRIGGGGGCGWWAMGGGGGGGLGYLVSELCGFAVGCAASLLFSSGSVFPICNGTATNGNASFNDDAFRTTRCSSDRVTRSCKLRPMNTTKRTKITSRLTYICLSRCMKHICKSRCITGVFSAGSD